ncbi:hypothetical protein HOLleu_36491 [Holothuria leucospilota]|uniref:Uncharacterized protein n=1 Tax=Holothuria leucospilota TaxID=206669 RepID=A0A9Q0YK51_HOLLE|nr:hypothetical protein HOLleu_36491 [Holothuria leucospilota]
MMNAVFVMMVLMMLISCIYASAYDREEEDKAIFLRNFGCAKPGEYIPHRPNAPNCPCGKYAIEIKTKYLRKYQERTGYWDLEKKRWQLYRCKKCDICYNVPVRKPCSSDGNTECGPCYPPLVQTNIGCLPESTNMSLNETTTVHLLPLALIGHSESTTKPPLYMCNNPCATENNNDHYEWTTVSALVVFLLFVIAFLTLVVLSICICQCQSQRRQRSARRNATRL